MKRIRHHFSTNRDAYLISIVAAEIIIEAIIVSSLIILLGYLACTSITNRKQAKTEAKEQKNNTIIEIRSVGKITGINCEYWTMSGYDTTIETEQIKLHGVKSCPSYDKESNYDLMITAGDCKLQLHGKSNSFIVPCP